MTRRRSLILMAAMIALAVLSVVATIVMLRPTVDGAGSDGLTSTSTSRSPSPTRATPAPTPTPTPAAAPPAAEPAPEEPAAPTCTDDVLVCVNQARVANGLGELVANGALDAAAQACAERMAASGQMTHSTEHPGGFNAWGENIAYGYPSAAAVFDGWMGSEGHRANILNPAYTQMGIGYVGAGNWWCQQFGG